MQPTNTMGLTIDAEPPTVAGYWLYVAEITERMSRNKWAIFFRCEIHEGGKLIDITQKRGTRSQALKDGEIRAARLRLLADAAVGR